MTRPKLEFWFEFASTYSYLSVMRLPDLARAAGVDVEWKPFLLGPIFASQGWDTSPFRLYAAKGNYMWRDMERRVEKYGLPYKRPEVFPQNGLLAARMATAAGQGARMVSFCQNVYLAHFAAGQSISDPLVLNTCAQSAKLPDTLLDDSQTTENKHALRLATEEAGRRSIFGAPSFLIGDELFWGDDRLEDALEWAVAHA